MDWNTQEKYSGCLLLSINKYRVLIKSRPMTANQNVSDVRIEERREEKRKENEGKMSRSKKASLTVLVHLLCV